MVWYFSDHGDFMGSHGKMQKSRPEEESSRIPLIVRRPGGVPGGSVSPALISAVDLMPTLLGALGLPVPDSVEGEDLSRCLCDASATGAESLLLQYESTFFPSTPEQVYRGLRNGSWKLVHWLSPERDQLYNLDDDPFEMNNRINAPECHDIRETLATLLTNRMKVLGDDFMERRQAYQNEHRW